MNAQKPANRPVRDQVKNEYGVLRKPSSKRSLVPLRCITDRVEYAKNRWIAFITNTTIHGVKEAASAPTWYLKTLWLLLLFSFTGALSYQIYHLTDHYFREPVVIVIRTMMDDRPSSTANRTRYELPLTLLLIPTLDLFNASPEANRALIDSPFDMHTRYYVRSLVDSNFRVPDDYNGTLGKERFDRYLSDRPELTWHDVISPFVANVSYWLGDGENFKSFSIVDRTVSSYMTYHFIKPIFDQSAMSTNDETKDILLDAAIDFGPEVMKKPTSDHGRTPVFCITSYGLASDMVRIKSGKTYKLSFDVIGHRRISLRRRPCVVDLAQYQSYDYEACQEGCLFEAEHRWALRVCYRHTYDWGFYEIFRTARPCSHGVHFNGSSLDEGGVLDLVEEPHHITMPTDEDMARVEESYGECLNRRCVHACQQMSVKFHARSSDFHERLGNKSMIWMTWPGPGAVPVYVETLQYTWDGYVGQVGGLMGLWLGASMISICDLVYVCCGCCFFRTEKRRKSTRRRKQLDRDRSVMEKNGRMSPTVATTTTAINGNRPVDSVDNVHESLLITSSKKPMTLC